MGIYYLVFFILYLCVIISENCNSKTKKYIGLFASIVVICFQGLRWENGTDWPTYMEMFNYSTVAEINFLVEPGWSLLNKLFNNFTGSYTLFLLFQSSFILFCVLKFGTQMGIENSSALVLSSFASTIFPVRADFAMGFIMLSYKYLIDRKLIPFLIMILLATTIHWASFVFIPFYFIYRKRISGRNIFNIYFVFCIVGFASSYIVSSIQSVIGIFNSYIPLELVDKVEGYAEGGAVEYLNWTPTYYAMAFIKGAIFLYIYIRIREKFYARSMAYSILLNLYLVGICVVRIFSQAIPYLARVGNFATIGGSVMLLLPIAKLKRSDRIVWNTIYALYCLILFYSKLNGQYMNLYVPYHFAL